MSDHAAEHGHGHHWETSVWPLPLCVGILFYPISFMLQFVYGNGTMAIVALSIALILTVFCCAGWAKEAVEDKYGWNNGYIMGAMPFFIVAEAFIFIAFFVAYWVMRLSADVWPPEGTPHFGGMLPIIMTVILVTSSITIHIAEEKFHDGDNAGFVNMVIATIVLGLVFLGCTAFEWKHFLAEGFTPATNAKGTVFYSLTGFHGSHVIVGLALFFYLLPGAMKGKAPKGFVGAASMYWHFVDIVWFFVMSQTYYW